MYPVANLVPHRPPMLLLDELLSHDSHSATCVVTLRENAPFMCRGRVPAIVAMEYLAQCVAAFATLHPDPGAEAEPTTQEALASLGSPRIGYLVGIRGLNLAIDHFDLGDRLLVTVKHVWGSGQGAQFTGAVNRDGEAVVTGSLTVFVPPEGAGALL